VAAFRFWNAFYETTRWTTPPIRSASIFDNGRWADRYRNNQWVGSAGSVARRNHLRGSVRSRPNMPRAFQNTKAVFQCLTNAKALFRGFGLSVTPIGPLMQGWWHSLQRVLDCLATDRYSRSEERIFHVSICNRTALKSPARPIWAVVSSNGPFLVQRTRRLLDRCAEVRSESTKAPVVGVDVSRQPTRPRRPPAVTKPCGPELGEPMKGWPVRKRSGPHPMPLV